MIEQQALKTHGQSVALNADLLTHLVNETGKFAVQALELVLLLAFHCLGGRVDFQVERLQQRIIASHRSDEGRPSSAGNRSPKPI